MKNQNKTKRPAKDSDEENDSGSDEKQFVQQKKVAGKPQKPVQKQDSDESEHEVNSASDSEQEEEVQSTEGHSELFVKNLSYDSNEKSLKSFFSKYGTVTNVKLLKRDDGKSKGIGFVGFSSRKEAQSAIDDASNLNCDGR
jgi:RNA recognition motif-containing protein